MITGSSDRMYRLLPAVYRLRDSEQGEPLRALLSLIQGGYDAVEQDIGALYENWFIETCAEWVVPYIGDLLGVRPLYPASPGTSSARAYVAHTLDYRRRKGTANMLEQLALDVTGWPARVVEFFELLATTQCLNHLRPGNLATADLRDTAALELLNQPSDTFAHTADIRHIANGRGRYNIPDIGIFVWRLESNLIGPIATDPNSANRQSDARAVATPADGRFTFDPLGTSAPLFNRPQTKLEATLPAREINLPAPLRRRPLYDELEALRQAEVDGVTPSAGLYFAENPVLQFRVDGAVVPFDKITVCDISDISATDWRRPPKTKSYKPTAGGNAVDKTIALSVDPVRGRIAFPAGVKPASVEVSYSYGFSGDIGSGPYDRSAWLTDAASGPAPFTNPKRWQVGVSQETAPIAGTVFSTFADAVQEWSKQPAGTDGVIAILDSRTYRGDLAAANKIAIPEGSRLLLVAADWPALRQGQPVQSKSLDPNGLRPHFAGNIEIQGTAAANSKNPGQLFIDGLLIEGKVSVLAGNLSVLGLSHATIMPTGGLNVASSGAAGGDNHSLVVNLFRAICGPIALDASVAALNATDSILTSGAASASDSAALTAPGATVSLRTSTVFGTSAARILNASDCIFTGAVMAQRRQTGCMRFCYLPLGSQTARRYHCQPDLAITGVSPSQQASVIAQIAPQFASLEFGQPSYAQLDSRCADEISSGAEDGSEMGAFSFLQQPQRMANLLTALEEYLRLGLEAGIIRET